MNLNDDQKQKLIECLANDIEAAFRVVDPENGAKFVLCVYHDGALSYIGNVGSRSATVGMLQEIAERIESRIQ